MRDGEGGERPPALAADVVFGADGDLVELVEHVELGQRHGVDAIEHDGGAQHGEVEPAGAARASGHRPELISALAQMLAGRVVQLRRERAAAHARGVRLGHPFHAMDVLRRDAQAGADA